MGANRSRSILLLAAGLLVVVSGCGARTHDSTAVPRTPSPVTSPPTTEGNGSQVPPLPDLTRTPQGSPTLPPVTGATFGADISWPQCPKGMGIPEKPTEGAPMPTSAARFVVLGLTNGPSFVANPCLESQLQWVRDRHLMAGAYAVVSYPDHRTLKLLRDRGPFPGDTRLGGLRNVGFQAALFNLATMRRVGLTAPAVWVDVEPITPPFAWSADVVANAAVVQGMVRGYRDSGVRIGVYSIGSLWTGVVGTLRLGLPEWRPAGSRGQAEAVNRCGADWSFQGGSAVLGQWIEARRDRDITCPGVGPADLERWFQQY